jgi:hypothetical protein
VGEDKEVLADNEMSKTSVDGEEEPFPKTEEDSINSSSTTKKETHPKLLETTVNTNSTMEQEPTDLGKDLEEDSNEDSDTPPPLISC